MRALYTAATGMRANQMQIENIANNLANTNSTSYKKVRENFEDLVYQTVGTNGGKQNPMQMGSGVKLAALTRDFRTGNVQTTSNSTDMLIDGDGFFKVEDSNGEVYYTRDGAFQIDAEGRLVTRSGMVVQPGIQVPPGGELVVSANGEVEARMLTAAGTETVSLGVLEISRFPNSSGLDAAGGNLYRATTASGEPAVVQPGQDGAGKVIQYALEGSNVDVAEELVLMISAQRSYELSSKVIQTADEMLQAAANAKR